MVNFPLSNLRNRNALFYRKFLFARAVLEQSMQVNFPFNQYPKAVHQLRFDLFLIHLSPILLQWNWAALSIRVKPYELIVGKYSGYKIRFVSAQCRNDADGWSRYPIQGTRHNWRLLLFTIFLLFIIWFIKLRTEWKSRPLSAMGIFIAAHSPVRGFRRPGREKAGEKPA